MTNNEITELCKGVHCVDLDESFQTLFKRIFTCKLWPRYSRERALSSLPDRAVSLRGPAFEAALREVRLRPVKFELLHLLDPPLVVGIVHLRPQPAPTVISRFKSPTPKAEDSFEKYIFSSLYYTKKSRTSKSVRECLSQHIFQIVKDFLVLQA